MCYNNNMKKMSDYMFHIGLQMRAYPSDQQKAMIRMNGGTIKLTSSTPEATTFTIVV